MTNAKRLSMDWLYLLAFHLFMVGCYVILGATSGPLLAIVPHSLLRQYTGPWDDATWLLAGQICGALSILLLPYCIYWMELSRIHDYYLRGGIFGVTGGWVSRQEIDKGYREERSGALGALQWMTWVSYPSVLIMLYLFYWGSSTSY